MFVTSIQIIPFVIIIIIYLIIASQIKFILYKFMTKPCNAQAFNYFLERNQV